MRFLSGQFALFPAFPTSNCSVGGSMTGVLFWKSPQRWLPRVIVGNQWSSSCIEHDGSENMLAQTREARLLTSLFHITHACSCFCVSTNCTWELWIFVAFVHRRCLNHIQTLSCLSASIIKNSVWQKYYRNVSEGVMGVMFLLKFAV